MTKKYIWACFSPLIFIYLAVLMSRGIDMKLKDSVDKREPDFFVTIFMAIDYTNAKILSLLGDSDAQLTNSNFYYAIDNNQVEGLKWLKKSAENGNPEGQYTLCLRYMEGSGGLPVDRGSDALSWCIRSAESGHITAQEFLSEIYKNNGNQDEASRWHNAAESGIVNDFLGKDTANDSKQLFIELGKQQANMILKKSQDKNH